MFEKIGDLKCNLISPKTKATSTVKLVVGFLVGIFIIITIAIIGYICSKKKKVITQESGKYSRLPNNHTHQNVPLFKMFNCNENKN